jgi:hypothetical protein
MFLQSWHCFINAFDTSVEVQTSITELTDVAVRSDPAVHADLISVVIARMVSELVVARSTELRARRIVVVRVTLDAHLVTHRCRVTFVRDRVPILTWNYYTRVNGAFDQSPLLLLLLLTLHRSSVAASCTTTKHTYIGTTGYVIAITINVIVIIHRQQLES